MLTDSEVSSIVSQVEDLDKVVNRNGHLFANAILFTTEGLEWTPLIASSFCTNAHVAGLTINDLVLQKIAMFDQSLTSYVEERRIVYDAITGQDPTDSRIDSAMTAYRSVVQKLVHLPVHEGLGPDRLAAYRGSVDLVFIRLVFDRFAFNREGLAKALAAVTPLVCDQGKIMLTTANLKGGVDAISMLKEAGFSGQQRIMREGELTTILATVKRP